MQSAEASCSISVVVPCVAVLMSRAESIGTMTSTAMRVMEMHAPAAAMFSAALTSAAERPSALMAASSSRSASERITLPSSSGFDMMRHGQRSTRGEK